MSLIDEAKKGLINGSIKTISESEGVDAHKLVKLVAKGYVVIPRNVLREVEPRAIGMLVSTKVNANVGTSQEYVNVEEEVEKAMVAQKFGADAVMDLSTGGDLREIRKRIMEVVKVPFGTVPIYEAARDCKRILDMSEDDFIKAVERQAKEGVDFMTIHAGVNWVTVERLNRSKRLLGVVSRGGAVTIGWMIHNGKENPYYENFDYILDILKEYDVTVSLGDAFRPGCIHDAGDRAKYTEFIILGELVEKCRARGVQCMVEGPGHVPIDEIFPAVKAMKSVTNNAPLYLLGPIVTDTSAGYDHISSAIGAAIAGMAGADFICYVTPAEHLGLPTVEDVKEGVIAAKIAAHAVDLIKEGQKERARAKDYEMSLARKNFDWKKQFALSPDPEKAKKIWERRKAKGEYCSMCGDLCAIKLVEKYAEGK